MNALQYTDEIQYNPFADTKKKNKTYFGDVLATAIVVFFAVSSLTISGWSALLFLTGNVQEGGPLGHIFHFVHSLINTSGIV